MKKVNRTFAFSGSIFLLVLLCAGCMSSQDSDFKEKKQPVDYVNPYMGNISHLLVPTFPTVHLPNSMLRVTPKRSDFTDVTLSGLPLILTSHRGTSAFSLSPVQDTEEKLRPVMDLSYDHEKLTPYSYSVYLDDQRIQVEYGLARQAASYELAFEGKGPAQLILSTHEGKLRWDGEALSGYQELGNNTRVFLYLVPDQSPEQVKNLQNGESGEGYQAEGRDACLVLHFGNGPQKLSLHYGISFIDEDQARLNMEREVHGKTVAGLQQKGREI